VLGRTWIIPHLPEFATRYPDVKLEIIFTNYDGPGIVDGQVDVAVQIGELQSSRLTARRLASRRRVLCASSSYLALHGVPRTPQELTSRLLIGYRSPRNGRIRDWRFRFGATIRKMPLNFYMVFNSAEALIAAAKAGLGVIETAEYYVSSELQSGELKEVLRPYSFEDSVIHVVFSKEQSGAKARVFIDFLVSLFNRPPWNKQSERVHLRLNK
jgi:LysR family transcriptional regulator, regulator for bpeEF and oprC